MDRGAHRAAARGRRVDGHAGGGHHRSSAASSGRRLTGERPRGRPRSRAACDHLGLHELLAQEPRARAAITALFHARFSSIQSDGKALWAHRPARRKPTAEDYELLAELADALACLEDKEAARVRMPQRFAVRFVIVEAVAWTIFFYALSSFFSLAWNLSWHYFEYGRLFLLGALCAAAMFAIVFGFVVLFLRGSSRAHGVLVECAILLVLAAPVAGVAVAYDINAYSRGAAPVSLECAIVSKDAFRRKNRKLPDYSDYYLFVGPPTPKPVGFKAPQRVQVSSKDFKKAEPGGVISLTIEPGALGIPWIAERVVRPPVTAPATAPAAAPAAGD